MPVLSYQVNSPGQGGVNPKICYIFTNDPIATVTQTGYIDWLANPQGIYPGDVALVVTRETPTANLGAGFYEFQRAGMGPHWNLVPESSGSAAVNSVTGTLNQLIASPTLGDVIISIDPDPQIPGTGSIGLPKGNTAQRAGIIGSIRFNTQSGVFEGTVDGSTWVAFSTGGGGAVTSITGTVNQIVASSQTGSVTLSIDPDPVLPGNAAVTLPSGDTASRGSIAGSVRFNSQTGVIEMTNDGSNWYTVLNSNNGVTSVVGTSNRIIVGGTNVAIVDIASNYIGQASIKNLGVVTTGTWNAATIDVQHGGTSSTSFTANAPLCGNGTGALLPASTGQSIVGRVLTSTGSGSLPTWQVAPGASGLNQVSISISAADFINSRTIPVLILAAPGANLMINPVSVAFELTYGSAPFSGGGGSFFIAYNSMGPISPLNSSSLFNGITSNWLVQVPISLSNSYAIATMQSALYLSYQGFVLTGGTGSTVTVHLVYTLMNTVN